MLADWQKKTNERCRRYLDDMEKHPEKYGVTREHLDKVNKKMREQEKAEAEKAEKERKRKVEKDVRDDDG